MGLDYGGGRIQEYWESGLTKQDRMDLKESLAVVGSRVFLEAIPRHWR